MVTLPLCFELHTDDVGAGVRLTHGKRAHFGSGAEFGEVAGFLLGCSVALELIQAQVGMGTVREAYRGRDPAYLFKNDDVCKVA